ncbi:MAG TPA: hypothetical protein VJ476_04515 [Rhizomicrobium sp.]|nr:hypothetical protein [Rhizomicrobium sp.]
MTVKTTLLATAFALALPLALSTSPAAADPHDNTMMATHHDMYHDHGHRPPMRDEHRPAMPHGGHYHWRDGAWNWQGGAWVWAPGIWIHL